MTENVLKFAHAYSKLYRPRFTTIRLRKKFNEGDVVRASAPGMSFKAVVTGVKRARLSDLGTEFLKRDTDMPTRAAALGLVKSFYGGRLKDDGEVWVYQLERPGVEHVVRGKRGRVEIRDCLPALRELDDGAFDVCLTDPPYNIGFKGSNFKVTLKGGKKIKERDWYDDLMPEDEYRAWCREWFGEVQRVSGRQIMFPGKQNVRWWLSNYDCELFYIINKCSLPGSAVGFFSWVEPILMFGKFSQCYLANALDMSSVWARDRSRIARYGQELRHPTPKLAEVGVEMLRAPVKKLGVRSVLDPFCGSGWVPEACEMLGLRYLCFEKRIEYVKDIEFRIRRGESHVIPGEALAGRQTKLI